jgi:hypothetical protein
LASDDALHLCVLGLKLFEPGEIAGVHPGVLGPTQPDRVGVNAVPASEFFSRRSGIELA